MAIKSSTFSGWQLSGKDAKAFEKQVNELKPNLAAQAALERGRKLVASSQHGIIKINATSKSDESLSSTLCSAINIKETKNKS